MKNKKSKKSNPKASLFKLYISLLGLFILSIGLFIVVVAIKSPQNRFIKAAPSAELLKDKTNVSFTANGYTSTYHVYAANLDWTKPLGLLIYTDGSGEAGLKNPTTNYLMGGPQGMIAVAKKYNMVLLTPLSPNKACSDGDGSCWYLGDPPGYAKWAEALVTSIETQYSIDKKRVAFGGYSSGATFANGWWVPSGAAQRTMDAGVIVAISYGGPNYMPEVAYTPAFKSGVHMHWNSGDADPSLPSVNKGYDHYTKAGFQTTKEILPGVGHTRSGEFGAIMDAQIGKYIGLPTGAAPSGIADPSPSYFCAGSNSCIPSVSPSPQQVPGTNPSPVMPSSSVKPSSFPQITDTPNGTDEISPIIDENPNPSGHGGSGDSKGLVVLLLQFFQKLLELLLALFK